jgi:tetratricopeptide (TPR) repeat protein
LPDKNYTDFAEAKSAMPLRTETDLNATQRNHWLKAVSAIELRNFGYAISLLQGILKEEPEFLTGRQVLRRAAVARNKAGKKTFLNLSSTPLAVLKAQREIRKGPKRAVELIEKVLEKEPYHRQANLVLKEAAVAAGWPEVGVFALRTLLEANPLDRKILYELGRLHRDLEQSNEEMEIYHRLTEIDPLDAEAARLGKDASARASMSSGRWGQAKSYRDLIKDKGLAVSSDRQNRMAQSGESLDRELTETYARHQDEPRNIDHARKLGVLYEQKEDFANAAAWYQYAVDLTNRSDAGLMRKVSDLHLRQASREIAEYEEFLAKHTPADESYLEKERALQAAKRNRAAMLLKEARKRVECNPTDWQLRLELGEHLLHASEFREAVPQLQRARQDPHVRLRAMNLLGFAYRELGMLDLAVKQFEEAAKEMTRMDAVKKEIVYNLGLAYAQMGEAKKSIVCMRQIYEADYEYKDVAERVETFYAEGNSRD